LAGKNLLFQKVNLLCKGHFAKKKSDPFCSVTSSFLSEIDGAKPESDYFNILQQDFFF
jgi:hypothetical protein